MTRWPCCACFKATPARPPTSPSRWPAPARCGWVRELPMGTQLGAWRLFAMGEGGMGRVYLAERADGAYEQQAALKLVRLASSPMRPSASRASGRSSPGWTTPDRPAARRRADRRGLALPRHGVRGRRAPRHLVPAAAARPRPARRADAKPCARPWPTHRSLVIHCDLKPANVLVDRHGRLRLLDFGVAHLRATGRPAGLTPGYASPEQLAGRAHHGL